MSSGEIRASLGERRLAALRAEAERLEMTEQEYLRYALDLALHDRRRSPVDRRETAAEPSPDHRQIAVDSPLSRTPDARPEGTSPLESPSSLTLKDPPIVPPDLSPKGSTAPNLFPPEDSPSPLPWGWCETVWQHYLAGRLEAFRKAGRAGSNPPQLTDKTRELIRSCTHDLIGEYGAVDGLQRMLDAMAGLPLDPYHLGKDSKHPGIRLDPRDVFKINGKINTLAKLSDRARQDAAREVRRGPREPPLESRRSTVQEALGRALRERRIDRDRFDELTAAVVAAGSHEALTQVEAQV